MTPAKQGLYEFNNDILVEIRKRMGISQSKMAELLDVQANTLSRWETGINDPDASALASIYSLAKEHGIDIPPLFKIRTSSLEVSISSKTLNKPEDLLASYKLLRSYLNTKIERIGSELAPIIKIEICNTAVASPDWPKIVFIGVQLELAHTGGDTGGFRRSVLKPRMIRKPEEKTCDIPATPWQNDSKREGLLKIEYSRIKNNEITSSSGLSDITPDEMQQGEVLFPGQAIIYEIDVTSELLPYLQFKVNATVSRRHLFHGEEIFIMPENITKPPALSALSDLNTIDFYGTLESVINSMPKFNDDTRLSDVQTFSAVLSANIVTIKETQGNLNNLFRQYKFGWFRAHIRSSYIYLDRVLSVLTSMKNAIESKTTDKIAAEASAIRALRGEAAQLKEETQELMHRYNISEEEVKTQIQEVKRRKEELERQAHAKALRIAEQTVSQISAADAVKTSKQLADTNAAKSSHQRPVASNAVEDDDHSDDDDDHLSNDAHQAEMDNHSNQMNPNNDAYWSSRGR